MRPESALAATADEAPAESLDGLCVLVTRPEHQADALCRLIEAAGGVALRLPLLRIAPVENPAAAAASLASAATFDRWIFSSSNAVEHAALLAAFPWPPCAAVGAGTAAALRDHGQRDVIEPAAGDGAAALLHHPMLQDVSGQRLLLVAGEDALPLLEDELRARHAEVATVAVYRRTASKPASEIVSAMLARTDFAIVTSVDALTQLLAVAERSGCSILSTLQLAVPSPRVVEKALELGFARRPLLPQRVSDAAWLELLLDACRLRREDRSRSSSRPSPDRT